MPSFAPAHSAPSFHSVSPGIHPSAVPLGHPGIANVHPSAVPLAHPAHPANVQGVHPSNLTNRSLTSPSATNIGGRANINGLANVQNHNWTHNPNINYSARRAYPYYGYPYFYGGSFIGLGLSFSFLPSQPIYAQMAPPMQGVTPLGIMPQPSFANETGMRITQVLDAGTAKDADLRPGDVIVGIGKARIQNFQELQLALSLANGPVDVIFLNGESGQLERLPVTPDNGKIGVAVESQELK